MACKAAAFYLEELKTKMMPVKYQTYNPQIFSYEQNAIYLITYKLNIIYTELYRCSPKPTNLIKMTIMHLTVSLVYRSVYVWNLNFRRFLSVVRRNNKYVFDTSFKYPAYMHR